MNFIIAGILINIFPEKYESLKESFGEENPDYEKIAFWIFMYICF